MMGNSLEKHRLGGHTSPQVCGHWKPPSLGGSWRWGREGSVNKTKAGPQTAFAQGLVLMSPSLMSYPCNSLQA